MSVEKHGISVGIREMDKDIFILIKPVGKITSMDYKFAEPILDLTLSQVKDTEIRVLIDQSDMTGMELGAKVENFKFELKQGRKIDKLAIFGEDKSKNKSKVNEWLISGEVKHFDSEVDAVTWLLKQYFYVDKVDRDKGFIIARIPI